MTRLNLRKNTLIERAATRTATVVVLGASLSLTACSFVPDWGNPVAWYDSVLNGIGGYPGAPPKADAEAVRQAQGQFATAASDSKKFPSLKNVPQQVPQTSSSQERRQFARILVADRDNAKYTDQVLRSGVMPRPIVTPKPVMVTLAPVQQVATARLPKLDLQSVSRTQVAAVPPLPPPAALPKRVMVTPAPVQQVATARLPKSDLQSVPRTQMAAVPAPSPSAVPRSQAAPAVPQAIPPVAGVRAAPQPTPQPASLSGLGAADNVLTQAFAQALAQSIPPVAGVRAAPQPTPQPVSLSGLGAADNVLTQAFAQALAQSASTVTTAPAGTSFLRPSAAPLTASQTPAPDIVRETYNQTLILASGTTPQITASSGTSFAVAPAGPAIVFFNNSSAGLNGKAKALIRDVAEAYKVRRGPLRIVGHASSRTRNLPVGRHKIINFRISLDRATAVANELIKLGVDKNAIQIAAVSDSQPVFSESMPEGEAGNRRAEIFYSF